MFLNSYFDVVAFALGAAVLSILGLLLTRKLVDKEKLKAGHEVGGYLLAVVGGLYAVLLGLIVVDAMQRYQLAREITERETNNLADVFIMARALPEPRRSQLQKKCTDYAGQVMSTEWEILRTGNYCPLAQSKAVDLMAGLMDFEPTTESEKAIYPQLVAEASQFWQNRQARVSMAIHGVPGVEWIVLVAGAIITVVFTYFFAIEHVQLQIMMTVLVAVLISLNLTLLLLFAYPFAGDLAVQVEPFRAVGEIFVLARDSGKNIKK